MRYSNRALRFSAMRLRPSFLSAAMLEPLADRLRPPRLFGRLGLQQANPRQDLLDRLLGRVADRGQWQAALRRTDEAQAPGGVLHRSRVGLDKQDVMQRH